MKDLGADRPLYQEAFDRAVAGLAGQDFRRSMKELPNGLTSCRYFGDEGRHCAYYFVNPEAEFVEGFAASDQPHNREKSMGIRLFYDRLQSVHDFNKTPEMMKAGLLALARNYGLEIPEVLGGPVT